MLSPTLPSDESVRLNSLYKLKLLDTPLEERYERITRLTKQMYHVPIASITLIDKNRQWFKSVQGLNTCETSRAMSFCGHTILKDEIFVIEDTTKDERFHDNPLVTGDPYIRFYAGTNIRSSDGSILGSLCIIDTVPRNFTVEELENLKELAAFVEFEIQNRHVCRSQLKLIDELDRARMVSMVDPLTRLWNREGIERILQQEISYSSEESSFFGVAIIDIDLFKRINDNYGHLVGDEILREFSKHLLRFCRNTDGIGRWGGEEFLLLINSPTRENVMNFAERIRSNVEELSFDIGNGKTISVTVTIGISFFEPNKEITLDHLIDIADKALYKGKKEGRNRVLCR